jgi:hypothetical protein
MNDHNVEELAHRSQALVRLIGPMLHGQGPDVQGAALCDLCAMWLAGHHPDVRAAVLSHFLQTLIKLMVINEKQMFGDAGFPKEGLH